MSGRDKVILTPEGIQVSPDDASALLYILHIYYITTNQVLKNSINPPNTCNQARVPPSGTEKGGPGGPVGLGAACASASVAGGVFWELA